MHAGQVPAWRARQVAEATIHATPEVGPAQLDRLVAEAIKRHHLAEETPDFDEGLGVDPRHARVDREHVSYAGTLRVEAEVSIADGIDLDHALAHGGGPQGAGVDGVAGRTTLPGAG